MTRTPKLRLYPPISAIKRLVLAFALALGLVWALAFQNRVADAADLQNPFKAAIDAYKKATQQHQEPDHTAPGPQQGSSPSETSRATQAQENAAPWTPPTDEPTAPVGPLDPHKLPDIVGIHLGMPLREAVAALHKAYPDFKITPGSLQMPTIDKPVITGVSATKNLAQGRSGTVSLGVVLPPNKQIVWAVYRETGYVPGQRPLNRTTLLAALRKKYGKETYSSTQREHTPVTSDQDIRDLYWLYDEQGNRIPPPNPNFGQPGYESCNGIGIQASVPTSPGAGGNMSYKQPFVTDWCASYYVALHVALDPDFSGDPELIREIRSDAIDIPLAMRAQKATVDWYSNLADKQHQQELEQSRQNQPQL